MSTNAQIAAHLRLKPHTVGRWRKQQDWDGEKLAIERQVAEHLNSKIASERTGLNRKHYKFWEALMTRVADTLKTPNFEQVKVLTRLAAIIDRAQRGQRLARGLNLSGQTEELIRAEAQSDNRNLVNLLIDIVKEHITDEATRNRIADAIAEAVSEKEGSDPQNSPLPAQC
jgi:hypothetical protein